MSSVATAPRRRLEPDARRGEILHAALRLYAEHAYDAVSTADLAREAGVARGLLHHYFGTKRALYLEALRGLLTIPASAARDLDGRGHEARAAAAIDWFLDAVVARRALWLSVGIGVGGDTEVEAVVADADETAADRLLAALDLDVADAAARARVRAFFGLVRSASREWLVRGSFDRTGVRDVLLTVLLTLLPPPSPREEP